MSLWNNSLDPWRVSRRQNVKWTVVNAEATSDIAEDWSSVIVNTSQMIIKPTIFFIRQTGSDIGKETNQSAVFRSHLWQIHHLPGWVSFTPSCLFNTWKLQNYMSKYVGFFKMKKFLNLVEGEAFFFWKVGIAWLKINRF